VIGVQLVPPVVVDQMPPLVVPMIMLLGLPGLASTAWIEPEVVLGAVGVGLSDS